MKKGGRGGSKTLTGLNFEKKVDLYTLLSQIPGYKVEQSTSAWVNVYFKNKLVARSFRKNQFYKFLEENKIDWKKIVSKRLYPDDSILVIVRNTLFNI